MALIAHFNQLYRWRGLFILDPYKFLFCLPAPLDKFAQSAEPHIYLSLHMAARLLSAVVAAKHEKKWAQLHSRHNRKSHKASDVRCSGCYLGGNDGQRRFFFFFFLFISEFVLSQTKHLESYRSELLSVFFTLSGKFPWFVETYNHWFDVWFEVSLQPQPGIDYLTGLSDTASAPPDPLGSFYLWLLTFLVRNPIHWVDCKDTQSYT